MKGVTEMTDVTTETKSAGAQFVDRYDRLVDELAASKTLVDDQDRQLAAAHNKIELLTEQLAQSRTEARRYLAYAVDLSGNLRFVAAGVVRALRIAGTIDTMLADLSVDTQDVPGADVADLENLMQRLGKIHDDKPSQPAIPDGVYRDNGTFYNARGETMGVEFTSYWEPRASEFPTSPTETLATQLIKQPLKA